jgi:hypothetical protein
MGKKAELIPWEKIEKRYSKLFINKKGNVAKALRMALGALIIQTGYGYSDEETALQIQETACLQFFYVYSTYYITTNVSNLPSDISICSSNFQKFE